MKQRRNRIARLVALVSTLGLGAGCDSAPADDSQGGGGSGGGAAICESGFIPGGDGECMPVGIQGCAKVFLEEDGLCHPSIEKCPSGTVPRFDEGCVAVGIAGCAPVFVSADGRCEPNQEACPAGTFAVPQEGCVPIDGPDGCGEGPWGNVVEVPGDLHVDATAADGGEGSRAAPFNTIAAAMSAVLEGKRVILAAGTYNEPLVLDKSIEVVGRCPSMVTLSGTANSPNNFPAIVQALSTASAALRRVRISGPAQGIVVFKSKLTIDQVHIENTVGAGIDIAFAASEVAIVHTWVQDMKPFPGDIMGHGVEVLFGAHVSIDRSAVTKAREVGILVDAKKSALSMTGSLVSGTTIDPVNGLGHGLGVSHGSVTIEDCALVGNQGTQIRVQGQGATLEARRTLARAGLDLALGPPTEYFGVGVAVGAKASAALTECEVRENYNYGVAVASEGASAVLDTCLIEHTLSTGTPDPIGFGLLAEDGASVTAQRSAIVRSTSVGVMAIGPGSVFAGDGLLIADTQPDPTGRYGIGFAAVDSAQLSLSSSAVVHNQDIGGVALRRDLAMSASATLTACLVERTLPDALRGERGVGLISDNAVLHLFGSAIVDNRTAAMQFLAAKGLVSGSLLRGVPSGAFSLEVPGVGIMTYEEVGDGIEVLAGSDVIVENCVVEQCARSGLLYDNSSGSLALSQTSGNRFGLVLQGTPKPVIAETNRIQDNSEKDRLIDGDLKVPASASELPKP